MNQNNTIKKISGNIVDPLNDTIYSGTIEIADNRIIDIKKNSQSYPHFIIPGFIDSHIHIESSMLTPYEFARLAMQHGTIAALADPHEIANILGIAGINYMIENGSLSPFKFYWGASSCVPATPFETSGSKIDSHQISELLERPDIKFLSEVMNVQDVINNKPEVMAKIALAKKYGKKIDGHAPGLLGPDLKKYINAGITTDHESTTLEEALEKINFGMKILIRQGSAAKNFEALMPLIEKYPTECMLCSDDKHPNDLLQGHVNELVKLGLKNNILVMKLLYAASVTPVKHYNLDVGLLQIGDPADFLLVNNMQDLTILETYINGDIVSDKGIALLPEYKPIIINNFQANKKIISDFKIAPKPGKICVIKAINGQIYTDKLLVEPKIVENNIVSNIEQDILKLAVINRYTNAAPALGFIKNFNLKRGAIASSVAHDSHNIIAVGTSDKELCRAINLIIEYKGGICAVDQDAEFIFPLPIAGLMSDQQALEAASQYSFLNNMAKTLGSDLNAPFMTLSFMALLVIPKLKLSDKGLFDSEQFEFVDLFE